MLDPSEPGFYKYTDADIPLIKAYLAGGGGIFIGEALAKAAAEKGFEEGVHYHVIKPIPINTPLALPGRPAPYRPTGKWR